MSRSQVVLGLVCCVLVSTTAHGDELVEQSTTIDSSGGRHLIYVELLGKAGAYGLGYEYTVMPWLALGVAGSFAVVSDQQIATAAPYLHFTLLGHNHHRMYTEIGGVLAHSRIPSPVSDWKGINNTGGGGFWSLGYEHTSKHVVVRASGSAVAGAGGLGPMIGLSIGARP